ncbi:MAG: 2-hydroxyacid dehydrogenase [Bacteroidales bacterium]|nr:2-hydroxyacid dehydrogenase [Bacteroidales bacterium]
MKRILILDKAHPILEEKLLEAGFEIDLNPTITREELLEVIANYQALIVRSKLLIDKEVIDRAENLKVIGRIGAGMDAIDVDYAEKKGIACINSPEGNRDAVGEHCLGLLLSLFNKICISDMQVRKGLWLREDNRGLEIKGKTIGIIGYGNMGRSFAQRLSGFDCRVIAYDKYKTNFSDEYAKEVSLSTLFAESDILSLHTPLTEETRFMINKDFIQQFKKPFYLLNTSRGKVVNTKDLIEALNEGKILGAGLDVLEYEAFSNELQNTPSELQDLFSRNNVVLTPHVAGWTVESNYKLSYFLAKKIVEAL